MNRVQQPKVVENLCKSYGTCVYYCPKKCMKLGDKRNMKGHYFPVIDMITEELLEMLKEALAKLD